MVSYGFVEDYSMTIEEFCCQTVSHLWITWDDNLRWGLYEAGSGTTKLESTARRQIVPQTRFEYQIHLSPLVVMN